MADHWFYSHQGKAQGPVPMAQLAQLIASGQLQPTDKIWPAGGDPSQAVEVAKAVSPPPEPPPPPAAPAAPDRLADVARVEQTARQPPPPPTWLADVLQVEGPPQTAEAIALGILTAEGLPPAAPRPTPAAPPPARSPAARPEVPLAQPV